jgi:hypothetical protein
VCLATLVDMGLLSRSVLVNTLSLRVERKKWQVSYNVRIRDCH